MKKSIIAYLLILVSLASVNTFSANGGFRCPEMIICEKGYCYTWEPGSPFFDLRIVSEKKDFKFYFKQASAGIGTTVCVFQDRNTGKEEAFAYTNIHLEGDLRNKNWVGDPIHPVCSPIDAGAKYPNPRNCPFIFKPTGVK